MSRSIRADKAVLDGEIVMQDERGRLSFNALQHRGTASSKHQVVNHALDLLHRDGRDMKGEPLERRRADAPVAATAWG